MFVKNTGNKVIGFGSMYITPGETAKLPNGFDENHPTVKFYLKKGWLTEAETPSEKIEPAEEKTEKATEIEAVLKEIGKMNLEPLRAEAAKIGVEFNDSDTKDVLKQKITEKLQAELE